MPHSQALDRALEKQNIIEDFYRKYRGVLKNYFMRRVKNHAEADDLTQDLLVRVTQQIDRNEIANPDAFVFTVAGNLLKNKNREWSRNARHVDELEQHAKRLETISPERSLADKQSLDLLFQHLDTLNDRARQVFFLHRLEGMKYSEIAQVYGISVSTVEKDISRAIAHLARCASNIRN